MGERQTKPRHGLPTAAAAALLAAACYLTTAHAAPGIDPLCDDVAEATLEVEIRELKSGMARQDPDASPQHAPTAPDRHSIVTRTNFLAPRARDAAREAFEDVLAEATPSSAAETTVETLDTDDRPMMSTRIPGLTDDELARYRRQMYRTDI